MGFVLSKELDNGMIAEYYKISCLVIDNSNNFSTCTVELYKDHIARNTHKSPIAYYKYSFAIEDNPCTVELMNQEGCNPVKLMYSKLKTLSEYQNAVDDI